MPLSAARRTLSLLVALAAGPALSGEPAPEGSFDPPAQSEFDASLTNGPWSDVRAFGAKGDGKADDTAAIQRAIDHVAAKTQGIVLFPPGAYRITSRLKVDRNVDLVGVGVGFGSQIIPVGTDGVTILGADWPGGYGFRNRIKGLTIMMSQAGKHRAIVVESAYTIKIEDVFVFNAGTGGGIAIANAAHVTLEDVSVYGTGTGAGVGISIQQANVTLYNPDVEAFLHGLRVAGDQGVHLFGGHFERHAGYGIRFERGSFNTITGVKISTPNSQGAAVGFFDGSVRNTVIGSRLDAGAKGYAAYQDSVADQRNLLMQSYVNGLVSEGIRQQ